MLSFKTAYAWLKRQVLYIKKSKTQAFNGALVLVGLLEVNMHEFREIIPPAYFGGAIVLVGMIGWYLRTITTEPLSKKVRDNVQSDK